MTTILSEHSRGISNSLTLSNRFIVLKITETYSVSTLQAVQLTLTKHFSVFYTSKQETQACIHIYRTRPLWKCTENPDDSLHHLLNLIKRITLLKGGEKRHKSGKIWGEIAKFHGFFLSFFKNKYLIFHDSSVMIFISQVDHSLWEPCHHTGTLI